MNRLRLIVSCAKSESLGSESKSEKFESKSESQKYGLESRGGLVSYNTGNVKGNFRHESPKPRRPIFTKLRAGCS